MLDSSGDSLLTVTGDERKASSSNKLSTHDPGHVVIPHPSIEKLRTMGNDDRRQWARTKMAAWVAHSAEAVEYTDCWGGVKHPTPTSVLDMTQHNLMVRFQQCWSFGECEVLLHCHHSQVHSGPEW